MEKKIPTIQQINLLNNNVKDRKKALNWINQYHIIMNPFGEKESINWKIPNEDEGLLLIKKTLIFLYNYHQKYFIREDYLPKREYLLRQIKGKITNMYEESDKRYYTMKLEYEKELEKRKELEKKHKNLIKRFNTCKNELHSLKIELNKERIKNLVKTS